MCSSENTCTLLVTETVSLQSPTIPWPLVMIIKYFSKRWTEKIDLNLWCQSYATCRVNILLYCADPVISLHSHHVSLVQWTPCLLLSQGTRVQIPWGVLMWNWDSPVSVVSLHWWPRQDWSLWPRLRPASSRTVTRPSCRQCDNPTWSYTAFLSRFHACCRSPFRLHNRRCRLLGGGPVESL
jgi:hypothetical protein